MFKMKLTRQSILSAIIRQSGHFPNCRVSELNSPDKDYSFLRIVLFNAKGDIAYIFTSDLIKRELLNEKTYYNTYKLLTENPQIKLKLEVKKPRELEF